MDQIYLIDNRTDEGVIQGMKQKVGGQKSNIMWGKICSHLTLTNGLWHMGEQTLAVRRFGFQKWFYLAPDHLDQLD